MTVMVCEFSIGFCRDFMKAAVREIYSSVNVKKFVLLRASFAAVISVCPFIEMYSRFESLA